MPRVSPINIDGVSLSWERDADGKAIRVRVFVKDRNGKYTPKRFDVVSYEKDGSPRVPLAAKQWAQRTREAYMEGSDQAGKLDLKEYGERYLKARKGECNARYLGNIERILNALVHAGIRDISDKKFGEKVREFIKDLKPGWSEASSTITHKDAEGRFKFASIYRKDLSPGYRADLLIKVRQVANFACGSARLPIDPFRVVHGFDRGEFNKPVFTISELRKILSNDNRKDPWFLPMAIMTYTGARVQEAFHFRWEWIDWEANTVQLREWTSIPKDEREEYELKTGERIIELQPELRDILFPIKKDSGWIIADPLMRSNGVGFKTRERKKPVEHAYAQQFNKAIVRMGIKDRAKRTAHSLRHTFISMAIAMDVTEARLMLSVGHTERDTTAEYGKAAANYRSIVKTWPKDENGERGEMFIRRDGATFKRKAG